MTRRWRSQKSLSVSEALTRIWDESKRLKALRTLEPIPNRQRKAALDILHQTQDSKKRSSYQSFLRDLDSRAEDMGPTLVMLCAIALGQARIANMNKSNRSMLLIQLVNLTQELDDPALRLLARTGKSVCPANESEPPECVHFLGDRPRLECDDDLSQPLPTVDENETSKNATRPSLEPQPPRRLQFRAQPNVSTISSSSSMSSSLRISHLDEDTRELLGIISSVGDCFPSHLLDCARNSLIWGSNGQATCPGVGVPEGYYQMLDCLRNGGFTIPLPDVGAGTTMMIHPDVPRMLSRFGQVDADRWKRHATNVILHAYPKDAQLRPIEYTVAGASLLPILRRALSYLHELNLEDLERHTLELGVDACLSASNFGDKRWKTVAVAYAENMADQLDCAVIRGRVQLRKATLARLYPPGVAPNIQDIKIPRVNNRSNADFGKLILLHARLQIDARNSTDAINQTLDKFRPFSPISELEQSVQLEINLLRAKLHRYDGKFDLAREILVGFMGAVRFRTTNMIMIHYHETLCEAGNPSKAIEALEYEYGELLKKEKGQSGNGRRLRLALGGVYLMKALLDRSFNNDLLEKAERLFHSVQWVAEPSIVTKHNYYVTKASLGMIHLLRSDWERSMNYWDEAFSAARDCFREIGHAEMVIQYAQCEVLYRLNRHAEALIKGAAAREVFQQCGRQYYFLGQGTAWLDKLDDLAMENGRPAITANVSYGL